MQAAGPAAGLEWLLSSLGKAIDSAIAAVSGNRQPSLPPQIDATAAAAMRTAREEEQRAAAAHLASLRQLQVGLAETTKGGVFAIGGDIALDDAQPLQLIVKGNNGSSVTPAAINTSSSNSSLSASRPSTALLQLVIPWQLPPPAEQRPEEREQLMQAILAQCNAAKFGRGNETVLDPTYRSAYHLPPSRFLTSFHPAQPGSSILSDIARMLNPSSSSRTFSPASLHAELYALNIYGVGGMFRAHVDTPRADSMFGSLVVCLPVPHQGGQLSVRHEGQSRVFDWSFDEEKADESGDGSSSAGAGKARQLQWAAFFGNCEHEVAAVTAGYRCTLTYNLYQHQPHNLSTSPPPSLTPSAPLSRENIPQLNSVNVIPLVRMLANVLADAQWMPSGGVVGIRCAHAYAHTSSANKGSRVQPAMLKGVDALIYSSLVEQLHLKVEVKLVALVREATAEHSHDEADDATQPFVYVSDVMQPADNCAASCVDVDNEAMDARDIRDLLPRFTRYRQPVAWLNGSSDDGSRELSVSYPTYGNESSSDCLYTEVALLVRVPPYAGGVGVEEMERTLDVEMVEGDEDDEDDEETSDGAT